jgi:hypothetical protein
MRLRRTAVAALLAAGIVVPAVSTAAVAFAQPATKTATAQKSSPKASPKASPKPSKTKKPVRTPFTASGKVTAVDAAAGTVTVLATGGTKDVRKHTVTITVTSAARFKINSRTGTLAAVSVGAKITVTGTRSGSTYTAARVEVSQKKSPVITPSPAPTVDPEPTAEPTPSTSTSPDDDPTEDPEDEISDDLSA